MLQEVDAWKSLGEQILILYYRQIGEKKYEECTYWGYINKL